MSSEIVKVSNLDDLTRLGELMAKSGFFKDAQSAAQCAVKILAGNALGVDPFTSMNDIHVIAGKPTVGAGIIASKIKASGKYDYKVKALSNEVCCLEFFERVATGPLSYGWVSVGLSEFSASDAQKAGTQNMGKFPRNMLFARAVSNGQAWYCPDVFQGSVYVPEEMGEIEPPVREGELVHEELLEPDPPVVRDWKTIALAMGLTTAETKQLAKENGIPLQKLDDEQGKKLYKLMQLQWALNYYGEANADQMRDCIDRVVEDNWHLPDMPLGKAVLVELRQFNPTPEAV